MDAACHPDSVENHCSGPSRNEEAEKSLPVSKVGDPFPAIQARRKNQVVASKDSDAYWEKDWSFVRGKNMRKDIGDREAATLHWAALRLDQVCRENLKMDTVEKDDKEGTVSWETESQDTEAAEKENTEPTHFEDARDHTSLVVQDKETEDGREIENVEKKRSASYYYYLGLRKHVMTRFLGPSPDALDVKLFVSHLQRH